MSKKSKTVKSLSLELPKVHPITETQKAAFNSSKNMVLLGAAGTGKTFISMYLAFEEVVKEATYSRVVIIRSAVPTRDIGFLPGTKEEKMAVYEAPYAQICSELFSRGDAYAYLKQHRLVEFLPTSFLRGSTIKDSIVIIDEAQNMDSHELDSIITRIGEDCKVIICGDFHQSDLQKKGNGPAPFMNIIDKIPDYFDKIEFGLEDIVRSGLVKAYLIAKYRVENEGSS